jgi:carboxymethylenebutenolidase
MRASCSSCRSNDIKDRITGMRTQNIRVKLRDGEMGAYLAIPDQTPAGAIIAIMEIWGVNDTMRRHAHEFAEAGFICLVPDLFWRQQPGVELSDHDPEHVKQAFDLYYDFDYDLAVRDMEDTWHFLAQLPECNGKVGAVGYCLGGKLCYLMCCRTDIDCAVAYYGTYIEHRIRSADKFTQSAQARLRCEAPAPAVRAAHGDEGPLGAGRGQRSPGAAAVAQSAGDDPQISRRRPRLRPPRR